jgi:hypothetical protein
MSKAPTVVPHALKMDGDAAAEPGQAARAHAGAVEEPLAAPVFGVVGQASAEPVDVGAVLCDLGFVIYEEKTKSGECTMPSSPSILMSSSIKGQCIPYPEGDISNVVLSISDACSNA